MAAVDEGARAVHRIEHPAQPARPRLLAIFLAKNSVGGPFALDDRADRALGALVGLGHRIEHAALLGALVGDIDALAEIGPDDFPGGIGQAVREGDCGGVDGHKCHNNFPLSLAKRGRGPG